MSVEHYENFPVASLLLPARLREPVKAIYAFARSADDIADEGTQTDRERLDGLDRYRSELDAIAAGRPTQDPIFRRLGPAIAAHGLPPQPFPQPPRRFQPSQSLSDGVCSSLQLINHWQDIAIDWQKGRVYLPQDELTRFGIREDQIAAGRWDAAWAAMMDFQIDRARGMMLAGGPLVHALRGRIGFELRLIVASGLRMLDKLQRVRGDVFRRRPVITRRDWPGILLHAAFA
ncbi:MAG: hypothetical protein B6D47_03500 [Rhodocyclaceae bacterium UTPRO2]|nr:MAG: hypothetical protein B6D47_03500 [Rhodocyclaceae bacterium UTPRO2]